MENTFMTRQFRAGNSQAVRIPANLAFPPKTELLIKREGHRLIVEAVEKTLEDAPKLFANLAKNAVSSEITRPEFIDAKRDWE